MGLGRIRKSKGHYSMQENKRKHLFIAAVIGCFITIFIYNYLTPIMSDDFSYGCVVNKADSIGDLFVQEYEQYNSWTGRSVAHIILRFFLYSGTRSLFNVVSSLVFTGMTLLMYLNVEGRKKYDLRVYLMGLLLVWIFGVSFAETILWETGTCNYLFTMTIILSFMTAYKNLMSRDIKGSRMALMSVGMLLLGILAGWCNENTSGAAILYIMILWFMAYRKDKNFHFVKPWMITGIVGILFGFVMMVMAPGNYKRAQYQEEEHSGLFGMFSRFQKLTLITRQEFFWLILLLVVLTVLTVYQGKKLMQMQNSVIFTVLTVATIYALMATVTPQNRALFGAGIFLTIACMQQFTYVTESEVIIRAAKTSGVLILLIYMAFTYLEEGTNMIRIYRELNERENWYYECLANGGGHIQAPQLRPGFESKYSIAYDSDISDYEGYWINLLQSDYYGLEAIEGIPRSEWTEY